MNIAQYHQNLEVPSGCVDAILDTDAYTEIDDQYAIAYLLSVPERIRTLGLCAAPFRGKKCDDPKVAMQKSYGEIVKVLTLMEREDLITCTWYGAEAFLQNEEEPNRSEAAEQIAAAAERHTPENPLYVIAIGALTNVASAVLLNREAMRENTVIVWLGGPSHHWVDSNEFNMMLDVAAARIVLGCGAPLVQLPCQGVVSEFRTTKYELEHWLKGKNPICDYLVQNTVEAAEAYAKGKAWSRCIWDVTAVAWLLNDRGRFMSSYLTPAPIPAYDHHYSFDPRRHPIRYVYRINRDTLFTDLFDRLANYESARRE